MHSHARGALVYTNSIIMCILISTSLLGCGGGGTGIPGSGTLQARERSFEIFLEDLESGILAFESFVDDPQQNALVDRFGDAVEEVVESTFFEFVDILVDRCTLTSTSLTCSATPLPVEFGRSLVQTGYILSLSPVSANSYTYTISKQAETSYTGSLSFSSGRVSITGTAPTFYQIGLSKFPRQSSISLAATVSPSEALSDSFQLTQGVPISLSISGTQNSPATVTANVSVPSVSADFSNLVFSFTPGTGNSTEVTDGARFSANGDILLTVGGDSLTGRLFSSVQGNSAFFDLTGSLALVGGQTGTLGITLALDNSNLINPRASRSSSNFQRGVLDFSLSISDAPGAAYASVSATYSEAQSAFEFDRASLSTTFRFDKTEGQRFVTLSTNGLPLESNSPEVSGEIGEIQSNQLVSVVTSGGFKVTLPIVNPQLGTYSIVDSDNQVVGKIENGLVYIGGTVKSLRL